MRTTAPICIAAMSLGFTFACGDDQGGSSDLGADGGAPADSGSEDSGTEDAGQIPRPDARTDAGVGRHDPEDCDPLDPSACALPWPSNLFLREDPSRATGFTLTFGPTSLPENMFSLHIDPRYHRRLDGYGLGEPVITLFPSLRSSNLPDERAIEASLYPSAPILLFAIGPTQTATRVPYFAELDSSEPDPAKKVLFVRPAVLLRESTRYVVAFRDLVDTNGRPIPRSPAFDLLATNRGAEDPLLAGRQERFDEIFALLEANGVPRESLILAFDFVTASGQALTGNLRSMRDRALTAAGNDGPELSITSSTTYLAADDGSGRPVDPYIAYELLGTFVAPSFVKNVLPNGLAYELNLTDQTGDPVRDADRTVPFLMRIPHSAITSSAPVSLVQFGHGLLGSRTTLRNPWYGKVAHDHRLVYVGCNWIGMAEEDLANISTVVQNLTLFPWIGDALQQAVVDALLLGRAAKNRLPDHPMIQALGIQIQRGTLYYSGVSQGGILGATYMAMSTDVHRGHLGVPGMNYSTLLQRSVDFTPFVALLESAYPFSSADRAVALASVQILWNQVDPVSYYGHLATGELADQTPRRVLAAPAKGDFQVAPLTLEILARSRVGIEILAGYDAERTVFGVSEVPYPHSGSGIVLYDFGNAWPPPGNVTPDDPAGDPHPLPRMFDAHNRQLATFLRTGEIIDVCGGDGCHPD